MDKKMVSFSLCAIGAIILLPSIIFAASFDCSKATSEVEKLICGNDDLSRLDESLHKAFLKALKRPDIKEQTIESQKQWLKNQRNACRDAQCIRKAYKTRIKELGLSSFVGIVFDKPPNQSESSSEDPTNISKPQMIESRVAVSRTRTEPPHEPKPNRSEKSDTKPSVTEELRQAAQKGSLEQVKNLVTRGADVNAKGSNGQTVLMDAAHFGNFELVKFLVDRGADVNAKAKDGGTALNIAQNKGDTRIVELLKSHGAKE